MKFGTTRQGRRLRFPIIGILRNLSAFAARASKLDSEIDVALHAMYQATDLLGGVGTFSFRHGDSRVIEGAIPAFAPHQTVILELDPI